MSQHYTDQPETVLSQTLTTLSLAFLAFVFLAGFSAQATAEDKLPAADTVKPQLYATGFEFAEGPAFDSKGNLFVVNYRGNGNIGRITPDGTASVFCDLNKLVPVEGQLVRANGLKVDRKGRLLASDIATGRLLRIAADGKSAEVLADQWEGKPMNGVNDMGLDLAGNVYFTDPEGSSAKKPIGSFYRYNDKTGKIDRLGTGLAYPNGIAVSPDQKRLCLGESGHFRVLIFDIKEDGTLSNRRILVDFAKPAQKDVTAGDFIPDGMVFDADGRLYVAMWSTGQINVIDIDSGRIIRQYDAGGEKSTNCHFHGGYLYTTVAAKEAVFRLKLGVEGFDYNGKKE
ncbi:MAG: SMP-30/gluconolactonase/LRE family protein [Pirellulales bacterium]|nr:SMP-30/gluconolactonase/LRE family protein [Pirellulales bacterium]